MITASAAIASSVDPPDKTVRVFLVVPNDRTADSSYPKGIAGVMKSSQKWWLGQCKYTFRLNEPVCEVIKGTHPHSWYATPDSYWTIVNQGTDDLYSILPTVKADSRRARWKLVVYVLAESPKDGGGGGGGWVGLPKHDCDGAKIYPRDSARWCGGMCHELGHCFGLPDASSTDGTVMSASFYGWPNCIFTSAMVTTMKNLSANSGFWADNITATTENLYLDMTTPEQWAPLVRGNQLRIPLAAPFIDAVVLYDLSGKRVAVFSPSRQHNGHTPGMFDIGALNAGTYMCTIEHNGKVMQKAMVKSVR
ncbi:MAG: T9SS type A sorting domain-containing protein [Chitinispirillaceae bacterium]|nr:T9SS type A sorting domain-containing protein [Chitinispirillaceae bacterium]